MNNRCEVSDLPPEWCGHCKAAAVATLPQFSAPAAAESSSRQFGPVIAAQYSGQCAGCLDRIDEGDSIRHSDPHGGFIHEGCEDE